MGSKNDQKLVGERGRPVNDELESIRAKLWFNAIARNLRTTTAYAVESFYLEKLGDRDDRKGSKTRSGKFYKYKRGEHLPSRDLVYSLEEYSPGAAYYYDHPFWDIAKKPVINLAEHYKTLANLRPALTRSLFGNRSRRDQVPTRMVIDHLSMVAVIVSQSDWDAITLALGLIREADFFSKNIRVNYFVWLSNAFVRFVARFPFCTVAEELYAYLSPRFLCYPAEHNVYSGDDALQVAMKYELRRGILYREEAPDTQETLDPRRLPDHSSYRAIKRPKQAFEVR
ncbi:MAG: hypothetical protein OEY67_08585 [Gammaproteobacteria bacterium]|nr:hypothetical protein [Gammaproteobacteria bacterium]